MIWKYMSVLGVFAASTAWAEPTVTMSGDCPGVITITVDNITPGECIGITYGDDAGGAGETVPRGDCTGTVMGLDPMNYAFSACDYDGDGSITFSPDIDARWCGLSFQILDMDACEPSAVEHIDLSDCEEGGGVDSWVGDGECDDVNFNADCDWDGGDCDVTPTYYGSTEPTTTRLGTSGYGPSSYHAHSYYGDAYGMGYSSSHHSTDFGHSAAGHAYLYEDYYSSYYSLGYGSYYHGSYHYSTYGYGHSYHAGGFDTYDSYYSYDLDYHSYYLTYGPTAYDYYPYYGYGGWTYEYGGYYSTSTDYTAYDYYPYGTYYDMAYGYTSWSYDYYFDAEPSTWVYDYYYLPDVTYSGYTTLAYYTIYYYSPTVYDYYTTWSYDYYFDAEPSTWVYDYYYAPYDYGGCWTTASGYEICT